MQDYLKKYANSFTVAKNVSDIFTTKTASVIRKKLYLIIKNYQNKVEVISKMYQQTYNSTNKFVHEISKKSKYVRTIKKLRLEII